MEFKRLRLSGFKSFVEPAELRIEPGLTGVVGPNGCGKSNLFEALRWVMGEGSPKSLRGAGMEDVIFAGTVRRPARDIADVTLTLGNSDRVGPVGVADEETIEVGRRIERGAGSAYRVNGRDVRQRDVQLLFADAATGAHSPALVSQGRIGAIVAAKPAERRALLEEAAGIAGLHVRRQEAELRLRATDANLARLDDILHGLSTQAGGLRRAAKTAERYRTLTGRLRAAEAQLLHARWLAASTAAAAARTAADAAGTAVREAAGELATVTATQGAIAAALPGHRAAAAAATLVVQQQQVVRDQLAAALIQSERRQRDLTQAHDGIRRDRRHEATVTADAATALAQLGDEAAGLARTETTAAAALPEAAAATHAATAVAADSERVLSLAIEAHAAAVAEMRATTAALDAASARAARADADAARWHREAASFDDDPQLSARVDSAAAALAAAVADAAAATIAIGIAETTRLDADPVHQRADLQLRTISGAVAAMTTEHDALVRQRIGSENKRAGATDHLINQITVMSGYEAGLAAALGDDLDAAVGGDSGRFWATADTVSDSAVEDVAPHQPAAAADPLRHIDPPLPAAAVPLIDRVTAPPMLHRRLRQVGIVDEASASALACELLPGQRLVTRSGQLWRWDGFRSLGAPGAAATAATADRLRGRNRLAAITAELPPLQARLAAAAVALAAADAALRTAADNERRARVDRSAADRAQDAARAAQLAAVTELSRRTTRADALAASLARAEADAAAARLDADRARAAVPEAAVPALAADVASTRAAVEVSRADLAAVRAAEAALVRDRDTAVARAAVVAAEYPRWAARHAASIAHAADLDARADALAAEAAGLAGYPATIASQQRELTTASVAAEAARQAATAALTAAEAGARELDAEALVAAETLAAAREDRARAETTAEHENHRRRDLEALSGERFATSPPRLAEVHGFDAATRLDPATLAPALDALTAERDRLGPVNLRADAELAELEASIAAGSAERAELDTAVARLRGSIGALNREGRVRLLEAFTRVDGHFRELYATLFTGGAAHLALVEADDPLEAGLEIMAQPPGKKLQSLTLLSGGEQALTAIALIFALFLTTPSPLCVLDEVDAPLDDANVERFCDLLDRMASTTATRFLVVTHNAVTMSRMHRLYGVTMSEPGVSQLVSVDLARAERLAAA